MYLVQSLDCGDTRNTTGHTLQFTAQFKQLLIARVAAAELVHKVPLCASKFRSPTRTPLAR
jgi:hypothetical protein